MATARKTRGDAGKMEANAMQALREVGSSILDRLGVLQRLGKSFKGRRDIYDECGYPKSLDVADLMARFERQDIAGKIVSAFPEATWGQEPDVYETEDEQETAFEKEWAALLESVPLYHYLLRADILSGIGSYGALLLGFDDGQGLDKEVAKASGRKLLYLQPFGEASLSINAWDRNTASPRYGLPTMYNVRTGMANESTSQLVHWSRMLHLAEGCLESDVYGTPRLQRVYNRLQDLETIAAGSSEMFWKGGFQGISFEAEADADFDKQAIDKMNEELQKFFMGLQRYLRLQGVKANQLTTQVASPKDNVDVQLMLIAAASGIPKRILTGSEEAKLAGGQDDSHWRDRVNERRANYAVPSILKPFIARCQEYGVLPQAEVEVYWDSGEVLTPSQRAELARARTEALAKYADSNAPLIIAPFQYLVHELGYEDEEAREILDAAQGAGGGNASPATAQQGGLDGEEG